MDWHYIVVGEFVFLGLIGAWGGKEELWERKLREIKKKSLGANLASNPNENKDKDNIEDYNGAECMEEMKEKATENVHVQIGTRDLLVRTLQNMGCPITYDENNNICFTFQGQHFVALAQDNLLCIDIHYPWWEQCSLFDVEQFAWLKKTINEVNGRAQVTTFFSVNNEGDTVGVHSKKNLLLIPQIPDIEGYLQAMLEDFFRARHFVEGELSRKNNS